MGSTHATGGIAIVAYSPDGNVAFVGNGSDRTVTVIDARTSARRGGFGTGNTDQMMSIAASPDGKYIVTAGYDKIALLLDASNGKEVRRFVGHTGTIWSALFSPDGKYLLTASDDKTARLWEVGTGNEIRRFAGHTAAVESAAFSPDGKYVLTGSDDRTARVWDTSYQDTIDYLCGKLLRDFSDDERAQYGITDKEPTCPKK